MQETAMVECHCMPLHAGKGQADTVTYLSNHGAHINSRDDSGCSALYDAFQGRYAAAARGLIDRGCDLRLTNDKERCKYLNPGLLIM